MTAPRTTIWELDPHTRAKHAILRRYLQAWAPILAQSYPEVAYIDGFAGPGRYVGGEDGSPIIALKAALDHKTRISGRVVFLFIEAERDRAEFLDQLVNSLALPATFKVQIAGAKTFEDAFGEFQRHHIDGRGRLPPTFVFIDPFGWKGVPFSVIRGILCQSSCEVLLTFMYEEINRFINHPLQKANFDSFFGCCDWRDGIDLATPSERSRFFHDLYLRQLKKATNAKYVRSFQMRNASGSVDYYLFYATRSQLWLKKMKEAMWKADQSGDFTFSDATDPNQLVLFGSAPRFEQLRQLILSQFAGRKATVGEVEEFVLAETAFRETHYKQQVLKLLEMATPPALEVLNAPPARKRGTYANPSLQLKFIGAME